MAKSNKPWKAMAFVGVIGIDLAVLTLAGFWTGRFLDGKLGTEPIFLIVGVLLGLALGIFTIIKMIQPSLGDNDD